MTDAQGHGCAGLTTNTIDDLVHPQSLDRLTVDTDDEVADPQAGPVRRRVVEHGDHGGGPRPGVDGDADAADVAGEPIGLVLDLIGRQEHRVASVSECLDHASNSTPCEVLIPQPVWIHETVLDLLQCLPEDTEVVGGVVRDDTARPARPLACRRLRTRGGRDGPRLALADGHSRGEYDRDDAR